jgi:hypothetical protein
MPVFYFCKNHKYHGDRPCPECFPIEWANIDAASVRERTGKKILIWTIAICLIVWGLAIAHYILSR